MELNKTNVFEVMNAVSAAKTDFPERSDMALFHKDDKFIVVYGLLFETALYKDKVAAHRNDIESMLAQVPGEFLTGATMAEGAFLSHTTDWSILALEELFMLGQGINRVHHLFSVPLEQATHGRSLPYMQVRLNDETLILQQLTLDDFFANSLDKLPAWAKAVLAKKKAKVEATVEV